MPQSPDRALADNRVLHPNRPRVGRNPLISVENAVRAGLAAVTVMAGVAVAKEVSDPGTVSAPIAQAAGNISKDVVNLVNGPTQEQEIAQDLLKNAPENRVLTNIVVNGEAGANMRTKPATSAIAGPDNGISGEVVGKLDPGYVVNKAIVVTGSNPQKPMDRESHSEWFAFKDPKGNTVFAWKGNFANTSSVTPFELQNH